MRTIDELTPDEAHTVAELWAVWPQALLMRPDHDCGTLAGLVRDGYVELIAHDNDVGIEARLSQRYGETLERAQQEFADAAARN